MKQILLLGDSIRMGYSEYVKELLKDQAEIISPEENCRSSQTIIIGLQKWTELCDPERVEVVHFNCGHWDAEHFDKLPEPLTSLEEYAKNLGIIVKLLRARFPNAKLIFATTTPMNPEYPKSDIKRTTEDLMEYNLVAKSVMQKYDVQVNDLFDRVKDFGGEYYADFCHFRSEGYALLGKCVYEMVK